MTAWWNGLDGREYNPTLALDVLNLPARAYAVRRWASSNAVHFHGEDLAAIALLALIETVASDPEFRAWPAFWGLVKARIDSMVRDARAKWANDATILRSITVTTRDGEELDPADVFTGLRVTQHDGLLHSLLAERIAMLPRSLKIALAFRYYENLTLGEIGGMVDATTKPAYNWTVRTCRWLLNEAKKATLDVPPSLSVSLPEVEDGHAHKLESRAAEFVWRKYGTDVSSWLGWIQICYRVDVSYILDMLDTGNGRSVKNMKPKVDRAADVQQLDALTPPPKSAEDVKARLGWSGQRARFALATWRQAHGMPTPKNGAEAFAQARSFAA